MNRFTAEKRIKRGDEASLVARGINPHYQWRILGVRRTCSHVHLFYLHAVCGKKYAKIAFQYDAYRPLVDRIPGGVYPVGAGGCLPRGVPSQGVCVSLHAMGQTPLWTDRHIIKREAPPGLVVLL